MKKRLYSVDKKSWFPTADECKRLINHVQNEANKRPNRTTKTSELYILILVRGLASRELLNLNICDLPCSHGEPCIKIRNTWGNNREVYLYDGLENKLNEYVQKYRKGAKPDEPLFVSRYGNRTIRQTLYYTLHGHKTQSGNFCQEGIGPKLGIENLCPAALRRLATFQLVGEKKDRGNIGIDRAITIPEFIKKHVEPNISDARCKSLQNILRNADRDGTIKLPNVIKEWKSGRPKYYNEIALLTKWNTWADKSESRLSYLQKI